LCLENATGKIHRIFFDIWGTKRTPVHLKTNMDSRAKRRRLSAHQKQIRFFTSLCIIAAMLFTALIFWLANAPVFPGH
jgi:hypothetical protein